MTITADATAAHPAVLTSVDVPRPEIEQEPRSTFERVLVGVFVAVPWLALIAAVPLAWGWGLGWHDVIIAIAFYYISGLGIAVGLHRYFTHGSFKAVRGFKIALAVAGSLAIEGPVITWVADHRRHHKYSDKEGDPHSPWRFGNDWKALSKGLVFAHVGKERYLIEKTVGQLEQMLQGAGFYRISRGELLNLSHVRELLPWFSGTYRVKLNDGTELDVSRDRSRGLLQQMGV